MSVGNATLGGSGVWLERFFAPATLSHLVLILARQWAIADATRLLPTCILARFNSLSLKNQEGENMSPEGNCKASS